ncbi:MAG: hypothetical protein ACI9YL_000564 [Luteibaculaceae bacterium]|jgi:hypothetical protein
MKNIFLLFLLVCSSTLVGQSFTESFEGGTLPAGWQNVAATTEVWEFVDAANSGTPVVVEIAGTIRAVFKDSLGESAMLATQVIDLSGDFPGQATVSFYMVRNDDVNENSLANDHILVSVDSTDISDGLGETLLSTVNRHKLYYPSNTDPGTEWIQYTFAIPTEYKGAANRIVFRSVSAGGESIILDNIAVVVPPAALYCTPTVDSTCSNPASFYIAETQVDAASIQTSTDADCGGGGYTDYSNLYINQLFQPGNTYTFTSLTASTGTAPSPAEGKLFIDWNQDGDFDDVGEEILGVPAGANFDHTVVVPTDALSGNTRARFMIHGLASVTDDAGSCGLVEFGEYEDYTLRIGTDNITSPDCPSNHSPGADATGICVKKPTFNWTKPAAPSTPASGFNFWLGVLDGANNVSWMYSGIDLGDTNSFQISDTLLVNTRYAWKVIPYNALGDTSTCDSLVFTTPKADDPKIFIADTLGACFGDQLILDPIITGGSKFTANNDSMTFAWSGDSIQFLSRTDTSKTLFSGGGIETFLYYMQVTDSLGCTDFDSVHVEVKAKATAGLAAADQLICAGDSAMLTLRNFVGTIQWQDSLSGGPWADVLTGVGSLTADYTTGSITQTVYYRTIVDLAGCTDTSNFVTIGDIQVPAAPAGFTVNADSVLCPEDSVLLRTNDFPGAGLAWILGTDTLARDTNQYMAIGAGEFRLVYLNTVGAVTCATEEDTIPITLTSDPSQPQIVLDKGDSICAGDSTIARVVNYLNEDLNLEWSTSEMTDSLIIKADYAGVVVYTDAFLCTRTSDSVKVSVTAYPQQPIISVVGDLPACEGDDIILVVSNHDDGIVWDDANTTAGDSLLVLISGTYSATVSAGPGCESSSQGSVIAFNPKPAKPVITRTGDSILVDSLTYHQWSKEGVILPDDTLYFIDQPADGLYTVISVNEFGCSSDESDPFSVVGILEMEIQNFSVYPNPTKGQLNLMLDGEIRSVRIFSEQGQELKQLSNGEKHIDVAYLSNGLYFILVKMENGNLVSGKFVKE